MHTQSEVHMSDLEIDRLKATQTLPSINGKGLFRFHLRSIEAPNSQANTTNGAFFIAHLIIAADLSIENPRQELTDPGRPNYVILYGPGYRQQRAADPDNAKYEGWAIENELLFLDHEVPESVRGNSRYMTALLTARQEDFTSMADDHDADEPYPIPKNPNPYDFVISALSESGHIHLALD